MASVTLSAGTIVNDASIGSLAWTNPSNAQFSDDDYATAETPTPDSVESNYLWFDNFAFAIPEGSSIDGIVVTIERQITGDTGTLWFVTDLVVRLVKEGTIVGDNKAITDTEWPTSDDTQDYGADDDLWGTTWSVDDVNHADFGFVLAADFVETGPLGPVQAEVDYATITVYYTEEEESSSSSSSSTSSSSSSSPSSSSSSSCSSESSSSSSSSSTSSSESSSSCCSPTSSSSSCSSTSSSSSSSSPSSESSSCSSLSASSSSLSSSSSSTSSSSSSSSPSSLSSSSSCSSSSSQSSSSSSLSSSSSSSSSSCSSLSSSSSSCSSTSSSSSSSTSSSSSLSSSSSSCSSSSEIEWKRPSNRIQLILKSRRVA